MIFRAVFHSARLLAKSGPRSNLGIQYSVRLIRFQSSFNMADKITMVIDCDPGIDDAVAIMMALSHPNIDLMAITCVNGNVGLNKVTINTLRILQKCDRLDVPVYAGVADNIIGSCDDARDIHGNDGLGDIPNPGEPPSLDLLQSEHAVQALIRMANEKPGLITLLAIGPLTNVGLAMRLDPSFSSKLKELIIMGGHLLRPRPAGCNPVEFNFGTDPEAAHIVLRETKCPMILVPIETCQAHGISYEWFEELGRNEKPKAQFISAFSQHGLTWSRQRKRSTYVICDGCAVVVAAKRDAILESTHSPCRVDLQGEDRGKMAVLTSSSEQAAPGPKLEIVTHFDVKEYYKMLDEIVK